MINAEIIGRKHNICAYIIAAALSFQGFIRQQTKHNF
jgi:hypothetical protein